MTQMSRRRYGSKAELMQYSAAGTAISSASPRRKRYLPESSCAAFHASCERRERRVRYPKLREMVFGGYFQKAAPRMNTIQGIAKDIAQRKISSKVMSYTIAQRSEKEMPVQIEVRLLLSEFWPCFPFHFNFAGTFKAVQCPHVLAEFRETCCFLFPESFVVEIDLQSALKRGHRFCMIPEFGKHQAEVEPVVGDLRVQPYRTVEGEERSVNVSCPAEDDTSAAPAFRTFRIEVRCPSERFDGLVVLAAFTENQTEFSPVLGNFGIKVSLPFKTQPRLPEVAAVTFSLSAAEPVSAVVYPIFTTHIEEITPEVLIGGRCI